MGNFLLGLIDFANIFKAFIGANYLSMPFTTMQGGLGLSVGLMLLNIIITEHCCNLIIKGKQAMVRQILSIYDETSEEFAGTPDNRAIMEQRMVEMAQVGNLAEYAFGKIGRFLIEAALAFTQCGFCVIYFIFIGTVARELFPMHPSNGTHVNLTVESSIMNSTIITESPHMVSSAPNLIYLIMAPFPIFWLSSMVKTIRGLGVISLLANLSIIIGWGAIYYFLINDFTISDDYKYVSLDTLPVFVGMVIPTFEGIGMMMPIENGMKGNRQNFRPLLAVAMYSAGLIVTSFGVLGYLRYGSTTKQILIQNIPQNSNLSIIVDVTLIIGVLFTYPLQNFPVIEMLEKWFFSKGVGCCTPIRNEYPHDDEDCKTLVRRESFITSLRCGSVDVLHGEDSAADLEIDAPWWKRYILRTVLVCCQLGVAIALRNMYAYVISFIGALGSASLAYIFPCAIQLKLQWNEISTFTKVKSATIIAIGVIASVVSLIGTIINLV